MEFKIGKKNHQLKFGMKAIRELDKEYRVDYQGLEFGMGINLAYMGLNQKNPTALTNVIFAATSHDNGVSKDKVDIAIEEYAEENDGLGKLFDEVAEELGKSKVIKDTLKTFQELAAQHTQ